MEACLRVSTRLSRLAAGRQAVCRRSSAASSSLNGAGACCGITSAAPLSATLSRWHPTAAWLGGGGGAGLASQQRQPLHSTRWRARAFSDDDIQVDVGVMVEGEPSRLSEKELEAMAESLYNDSLKLVKAAALYIMGEEDEERDEPPAPLELSLVLCDDAHIQELNLEWRGVDAPTDVLSFELEDGDEGEVDEEGNSTAPQLPVNVLGDVVISLDTAARQAAERQYGLMDETRVLLVHGVLHLLGFDHEEDEEEAAEMAAAEQHLLKAMGWKGQGLIALAGIGDDVHGDGDGDGSIGSSSSSGRGG